MLSRINRRQTHVVVTAHAHYPHRPYDDTNCEPIIGLVQEEDSKLSHRKETKYCISGSISTAGPTEATVPERAQR